jgi:hypothetical protein
MSHAHFSGVSHVSAQLSSHGPLLIVDLPWARESTLQMPHHLVRPFVSHPILFVRMLRPEEVRRSHPLLALQRRLDGSGFKISLRLALIEPKDKGPSSVLL